MEKNKHLDLQARLKIEGMLDHRKSFKAIGAAVEKDCTTISKEVKNHVVYEKTGALGKPFNDCLLRKECHQTALCSPCGNRSNRHCSFCSQCRTHCGDYQKELCPRLSKPPYVCNGCLEKTKCTLEKAMYRGAKAQKEYELVRSESRSGFNISESELASLDQLVSPLIQNGQSIHHICASNPGLINCCEKTLYAYADAGLLTAKNLDMPRKVRFRVRKKKSVELKVDKACQIGRTYEDYQRFMEDHPDCSVCEIDTVEGTKGGAVLLTIHFPQPKLQLAFKRTCNNSQSVTDIFNWIYETIGPEAYGKLFSVVLADNGTEFSNPSAIEFDEEGNRRSHVFYCHPFAPHEKGACENNHEFIRRIIPKGVDISPYSIGKIYRMMSHINSYGRPELGDHSPYEVFSFLYGEEILTKLKIYPVARNEILLKPSLMRRKL